LNRCDGTQSCPYLILTGVLRAIAKKRLNKAECQGTNRVSNVVFALRESNCDRSGQLFGPIFPKRMWVEQTALPFGRGLSDCDRKFVKLDHYSECVWRQNASFKQMVNCPRI
jgi:hypothetical protein